MRARQGGDICPCLQYNTGIVIGMNAPCYYYTTKSNACMQMVPSQKSKQGGSTDAVVGAVMVNTSSKKDKLAYLGLNNKQVNVTIKEASHSSLAIPRLASTASTSTVLRTTANKHDDDWSLQGLRWPTNPGCLQPICTARREKLKVCVAMTRDTITKTHSKDYTVYL